MSKEFTLYISDETYDEIILKLGKPCDFVFDYIDGGSDYSDVRRMKEYVFYADQIIKKQSWHKKLLKKLSCIWSRRRQR